VSKKLFADDFLATVFPLFFKLNLVCCDGCDIDASEKSPENDGPRLIADSVLWRRNVPTFEVSAELLFKCEPQIDFVWLFDGSSTVGVGVSESGPEAFLGTISSLGVSS
jgi:hypothetical protein